MARHNKITIKKPQYRGNHHHKTKDIPNKIHKQITQPNNNILSDTKTTKLQRIYHYLKYVSTIKNNNYTFKNIINFLHQFWQTNGNILLNNDIAKLISSKYVSNDNSSQYRYGYIHFIIANFYRMYGDYHGCGQQICDVFINSYDKYSTNMSYNDPLNYPEIVTILKDSISHNDDVKSIALQMALDRKNMYCVSLILRNTVSLNNIIVTLAKYNVYVEELGCNLATYVVDKYLNFDVGRWMYPLTIDNNLVNSMDSFVISIIKRHYHGTFKLVNAFDDLLRKTYEQLSEVYVIHKYVIIDVLLNIASKCEPIDDFLNCSTTKSLSLYESKQYCIGLIKTKRQFLELWNVDVVYISQVNTKLIYLLLMIAKDSRYKNSGFKYLMRKIIGWYYCLLY